MNYTTITQMTILISTKGDFKKKLIEKVKLVTMFLFIMLQISQASAACMPWNPYSIEPGPYRNPQSPDYCSSPRCA